MFAKLSRYRRLPDVVTTDAKGRTLRSKSVRLLPQVSGDFFHTVEEIDRLDHLAHKYYRQPRKWWRICDANPAFTSPQALLGGEPLVTARFPLTFTVPHPPWAEVLEELSETVGVDQAWMDGARRTPETQIDQGNFRFHMAPAFHADLADGAISQELREVFKSNGIPLSEGVIVSSADNRWLIVDEGEQKDAGQTCVIVPVPNEDPEKRRLDVYDCVLSYEWSVLVTYNQMNVSAAELDTVMSNAGQDGLEVGHPEMIGRVGKQIVIPPDAVR